MPVLMEIYIYIYILSAISKSTLDSVTLRRSRAVRKNGYAPFIRRSGDPTFPYRGLRNEPYPDKVPFRENLLSNRDRTLAVLDKEFRPGNYVEERPFRPFIAVP